MYQPRVFREDHRSRLHDLIERHAFGMLLVPSPDGFVEASHLPFHLHRSGGPHGRLTLHVARANPIWEAALAASRVTAVFTGPHAYVSPLWYEHPNEQVPTWNYAVVHARGVPRLLNEDELRSLLDMLVETYEGDSPGAWRATRLSAEFRNNLIRQIVGLSIEITELSGKFKLSQNRSETDRRRVIDALCERGTPDDVAMAVLMT